MAARALYTLAWVAFPRGRVCADAVALLGLVAYAAEAASGRVDTIGPAAWETLVLCAAATVAVIAHLDSGPPR